MKNVVISKGLFITALWMLGCGGSTAGQEPTAAETEVASVAGTLAADETPGCTSDADCVPATCCHPSACVPATEAPSCEETMCTSECKDGTMDCGKGVCACIDDTCAVQWK